MIRRVVFAVIAALSAVACGGGGEAVRLLDPHAFEMKVDGKDVGLYTLTGGDLVMQVTPFGGRVVALWAPDRDGQMADVVLGLDSLSRYLHNNGERFLGACVGRYANRIAGGKFMLDGCEYTLPQNNNGQCLHGGLHGLDMVVWRVEGYDGNHIVLRYLSPDGDEGFPAQLSVTMTYTLTDDNVFRVEYSAVCDARTVVNLSHHSFFNLRGEGSGTVLDDELIIAASHTTPVDSLLIPTGEIRSVEGTPFDFRTAHTIGERIDAYDEQLHYGHGYDHNWILDRRTPHDVEFAVRLYNAQSGRQLEVWTTEPALQFYSGNFFDSSMRGKGDARHNFREAVVFETQHYPDSPNHANFPSTVLLPDEEYRQTCEYRFSVRR